MNRLSPGRAGASDRTRCGTGCAAHIVRKGQPADGFDCQT